MREGLVISSSVRIFNVLNKAGAGRTKIKVMRKVSKNGVVQSFINNKIDLPNGEYPVVEITTTVWDLDDEKPNVERDFEVIGTAKVPDFGKGLGEVLGFKDAPVYMVSSNNKITVKNGKFKMGAMVDAVEEILEKTKYHGYALERVSVVGTPNGKVIEVFIGS